MAKKSSRRTVKTEAISAVQVEETAGQNQPIEERRTPPNFKFLTIIFLCISLLGTLAALIWGFTIGFDTVFFVLATAVFASVCVLLYFLSRSMSKEKSGPLSISFTILWVCIIATVAAILFTLNKDNETAIYVAAASTALGVFGIFFVISGVPSHKKD